ncbi:MAG: hypothetical protein MUO82_02180 [Candidatus Thermoplasmatota archaeon]|nr:hypothetical protein [Candidatus Thermoplasmatota archaeon]
MKKQLIILGIIIILLTVGFSGCNEQKQNTDNIVNDNKAFLDYLSNDSYEGIQMPSVDIINKNNTQEVRTWAESTIQALDENITILVAFAVSDIYKPIQNEHLAYYNSSREAAESIKKACEAIDNKDFNTSLNYFKDFNYYTNQSITHLQKSLNLIKELRFKVKILGAWSANGTSGTNKAEGYYIFFTNGTFLARSSKTDTWGTFNITDKKLTMSAKNETFNYDYTFSLNDNKVTLKDESWTIILTRQ